MSEKQMSFIVEYSSTRRKAFWKSLTFLISDSGTLVFGSGAKKTAHQLQKQREKKKKVQSGVLDSVGK